MIRETGTVPPLQAHDPTTVRNMLMTVDAESFLRIAALYPKTEEDLKVRALERREFFLKSYRKGEKKRKAA